MAKKKLTKLERSNRAHERLMEASLQRIKIGIRNWNDELLPSYHSAIINKQVDAKRVFTKAERQKIYSDMDIELADRNARHAESRAYYLEHSKK